MVKFLSLIFLLALLLWFRFITFFNSQPVYKPGEQIRFTATLHEEPDLSNRGQKFSIRTSTNQIIFITAKATPRLQYGQELEIIGNLEEKKMEKDRKILLMYQPGIFVRSESDFLIAQLANSVRERSRNLFKKSLPPVAASLLSGIVFGSKERFSQEFKQSLSVTGVLHVIAASGMNVTFVAGALIGIFGYFLRRQVALIAAASGIAFYVFLVGFEPSILRASIMALLALGASLLGRQNYAFFTLFLTGIVMLLWKPYFLFDVGFQLSFMATLGILLSGGLGRFGGELSMKDGVSQERLGGLGKIGEIFRESISTTFAAQAATLPILLGVFGSFGVLSIFVNAFVLWTVPILMTLGSVAVIVGFIFEPLAQMLLYLCLPFLLFFESVIAFFGEMNINVTIESFSWPMTVGYYLFLAAIFLIMKSRRSKRSE